MSWNNNYYFNCGVCGVALAGMNYNCHQCGSQERHVSSFHSYIWTAIGWAIILSVLGTLIQPF